MDNWEKAYEKLKLGEFDRSPFRFLFYSLTVAFWTQVAVWLLLRTELIPRVEDIWGWLVLSLLASPGNIRAMFLIALGPNPSGERETVIENEGHAESPRRRRRIQFRLRRGMAKSGKFQRSGTATASPTSSRYPG